MHDAAERVAPHTVFVGESLLVHPPQLVRAYLRVLFPRLKHELNHKPLQRETLVQSVLVRLVKGLSCHTGQRTEAFYWISLFSVQPFGCPVSAFFSDLDVEHLLCHVYHRVVEISPHRLVVELLFKFNYLPLERLYLL